MLRHFLQAAKEQKHNLFSRLQHDYNLLGHSGWTRAATLPAMKQRQATHTEGIQCACSKSHGNKQVMVGITSACGWLNSVEGTTGKVLLLLLLLLLLLVVVVLC
jgi:hypothetical protein